jgi:hypothetical protein
MKEKIFFELSLIFLLTGLTLVSGAMTSGSFQVNTGGDKVVISTTCQESWTAFWSTCNNGIQTYVCTDSNNCNTTDMKPALCGTTQVCTVPQTSTGGGGGGGGGGSSGSGASSTTSTTSTNSSRNTCIENWNCTSWSDFNNNCGTRTCNDKNNCGTTLLKPATTKACSNGITGGVIGAITNFAKTPAGIVSITFVVVVLLVVIITASQVRLKKMRTEGAKQQEIQKKSEEKPAKGNKA